MQFSKLPDMITSIGECTFSNGSALESVVLPLNVSSIGEKAFSNCEKLTSVTIMNPCCEIYSSASTIYNSYDSSGNGAYLFTGTIYGYTGSTAQIYAQNYNRRFGFLDLNPLVTTAYTDPAAPVTSSSTATTSYPSVTNTTTAAYTTQTTAVSSSMTVTTTIPSNTTAFTTSATTVPDPMTSGDINGDGTVTLSDAVLLCRYVTEDTTMDQFLLELLHPDYADTDGDGILTVLDVTAILRIILQKGEK